jgi:ferrous iron transport protein B
MAHPLLLKRQPRFPSHLRLQRKPMEIHIALVGNPNSGKTSLFNALTGLNQKVGNFPGVTVDKKTGHVKLEEGFQAALIDLPGTYSLYPRRSDEWVAYKVLMGADPTCNRISCCL